jgi:hypothetical protein
VRRDDIGSKKDASVLGLQNSVLLQSQVSGGALGASQAGVQSQTGRLICSSSAYIYIYIYELKYVLKNCFLVKLSIMSCLSHFIFHHGTAFNFRSATQFTYLLVEFRVVPAEELRSVIVSATSVVTPSTTAVNLSLRKADRCHTPVAFTERLVTVAAAHTD